MKSSSPKQYDIMAGVKASGENLPKAPVNPYRKRPVKLAYDKNEFYSFRLPSEHHFLLGSMDTEDIFGKRKGIEHSPHIRSQLDLDSNMLWLWFFVTFVALALEMKYHDEFVALRHNFTNSDKGKFEYDDFK